MLKKNYNNLISLNCGLVYFRAETETTLFLYALKFALILKRALRAQKIHFFSFFRNYFYKIKSYGKSVPLGHDLKSNDKVRHPKNTHFFICALKFFETQQREIKKFAFLISKHRFSI